MQITALTLNLTILSLISSSLAIPTTPPSLSTRSNLIKRDGIDPNDPGNLTGDDLKAWNDCKALPDDGSPCSRIGTTGGKSGCYTAEISIQKPCGNAGVQRRLNEIYCSTQPKGTKFCK